MHKAIVYIDESGTLPDPADTVVVVAAVGAVAPERIDAIFKRVNIADMVAGAILASETSRDTRFSDMIKRKISRVRRIDWRVVKERLLATKKLA